MTDEETDELPDEPAGKLTGELTVDATGQRCPLPIIRLAAAARGATAGTVITVLSTDPAAEPDVQAWCRLRGHELLHQLWDDESRLHSTVRIRREVNG